MPAVESNPVKPETKPSMAAGPPPMTEPPPVSPPPIQPKVEAAPLVPAARPPSLESVPASATSPPTVAPSEAVEPSPGAATIAPAAATATATLGAGWVKIQSGGRRTVGSGPIVSTPSAGQADPPRIADGPRLSEDLTAADQVQPVLHRVLPGENFWTISKLYYGSGRYYKALWAVNQRQVPKIDELYVGTVLRVPPSETLDRSKIDRSKTDDPATSTASRTTPKRADPAEEADLALPVRPRLLRSDPEPSYEPRRPTYTVKPHETLRSIARDTLNDPKRDREIFNLNRDVLDDLNVLSAGTTLTLPADATVGRRLR